ncbi:MAG: VIT family protein [Cyanobacteria bacterium]|nr:VIT family protein [Cyanobacteriota bacterium]
MRHKSHTEMHVVSRLGWLRASVLGANDGVLSTSSLIIWVSTAHGSHESILIAGISGLVAGAMSMAAGEYVSVSSQADSEKADLAREAAELQHNPSGELKELAVIYEKRGLDKALALQVAQQLTAHDALEAHAQDELGISETSVARPIQAALTSALAFALGALLPLALVVFLPTPHLNIIISGASLLFLALLGMVGAKLGEANMLKAAVRVTFWGAIAMGITAGIGLLFGTQA